MKASSLTTFCSLLVLGHRELSGIVGHLTPDSHRQPIQPITSRVHLELSCPELPTCLELIEASPTSRQLQRPTLTSPSAVQHHLPIRNRRKRRPALRQPWHPRRAPASPPRPPSQQRHPPKPPPLQPWPPSPSPPRLLLPLWPPRFPRRRARRPGTRCSRTCTATTWTRRRTARNCWISSSRS